jgi:zinc and cadmium transporter
MTTIWLWIALAVLADGAAALAGGLLAEDWLLRHRLALTGFAAGVLLAATMLDIVPEAIEASGTSVLAWLLASFVIMALFEQAVARHGHRRGVRPPRIVPLALLGSDALHNVADGAAIAAAFLSSIRLGIVTSIAVILHELPEEIADYVLLRSSGFSRRRALLALSGVQLTAALGALATAVAWSLLERVSGVVLAVAGGTFLYIAATDLLPAVLHAGEGDRHRRHGVLGFLLGVAMAVAATAP